MDSPEDGRTSLTERYKIDDAGEDVRSWARLLDFESPIKVESDWYSTRTFQVFLDALDINQPTTLGRGSSSNSTGSGSAINASKLSVNSHDDKQSTKINNNPSSPSHSGKDKKDVATTDHASKQDKSGRTSRHQQSSNQFETILSAEALKILSELPDLSHMSATRSFIFPATATTTNTTTMTSSATPTTLTKTSSSSLTTSAATTIKSGKR